MDAARVGAEVARRRCGVGLQVDGRVERPLLVLRGAVGVAVEKGDVQLDRLVHVKCKVGLVEVCPVGDLRPNSLELFLLDI